MSPAAKGSPFSTGIVSHSGREKLRANEDNWLRGWEKLANYLATINADKTICDSLIVQGFNCQPQCIRVPRSYVRVAQFGGLSHNIPEIERFNVRIPTHHTARQNSMRPA